MWTRSGPRVRSTSKTDHSFPVTSRLQPAVLMDEDPSVSVLITKRSLWSSSSSLPPLSCTILLSDAAASTLRFGRIQRVFSDISPDLSGLLCLQLIGHFTVSYRTDQVYWSEPLVILIYQSFCHLYNVFISKLWCENLQISVWISPCFEGFPSIKEVFVHFLSPSLPLPVWENVLETNGLKDCWIIHLIFLWSTNKLLVPKENKYFLSFIILYGFICTSAFFVFICIFNHPFMMLHVLQRLVFVTLKYTLFTNISFIEVI